MAYGIQISTTAGQRLIDGQFMVPEFVGKLNLNPTPVYNYTNTNSYLNAAGVFNTRTYEFANDAALTATNAALAGRTAMVFWKYPDTGSANLWWVAYNYGAMNCYTAPGTAGPSTLPTAYVFAVGSATASSEGFGMRLWDAAGTMIFDSGKKQLVTYNVATGMDYNIFSAKDTVSVAMPMNAGFLQPTCYYINDQRVASSDEYPNSGSFHYWVAQGGMHRNGGTVESYMALVEQFDYDNVSEPNDWNDSAYFGSHTGLVMPIINTDLYD